MSKLRVMELFSGYGSQRMALRNLGVDFESVGISEIDIPVILSYASIHDGLDVEDETFEYPTKEEMIEFLESKNIGLDFKTGKVKLPKNLDKLKQIYRATVLSKCFGDVSLLSPSELPDVDFITYSFPCTDISVAGQQKGIRKGQTRSGLLYECEKIIEEKRPKYLLMENVKNLVGKKFKEQFDEWLYYLESLGYTNYWQVLNAKDYGVPQNRERVFAVSILNDEDKSYAFPQKQQLNICLKDILESQVEEKYYLSEEIQARFKPNENFKDMSANIVETTAPEFRTIGQRDLCYQERSIMGALVATDYKQPKQIVERIGGCFDTEDKTRQAGSVFNEDGLSPTLTTMEGGYRQPCITVTGKLECDGWYDVEKRVHDTNGLGVCVETKNRAKYIELNKIGSLDGKHEQSSRVYSEDGVNPTVMADPRSPQFLQNSTYRIRKLTPLECWRLMGCSDEDFYKAKQFNSDSQLYKQAGNSIVVNVLEGIFANMLDKTINDGDCL